MGLIDRWKTLFEEKPVKSVDYISSLQTKNSAAATAIAEDTSLVLHPHQSLTPGVGDLNKPGDEPYSWLLDKYARYVWVYVAVDRIVNAVSQVDLLVKDKRRSKRPDDEAKGLAMGLDPLIKQPNPWMGTVEFIETIAMHLLLTGNAYVELAELDSRNRPRELYVLNPKNMKVSPSRTEFVSGYQYIVNDKIINFGTEEIVHIKLPDPRGESHYGVSPLAALRWTIEQERQVTNWNVAYFNNATWPSGIIVAQDGMNETEFKRARASLKKDYEGSSKVGKVMLLTGGLDWKQTTPNPKDLDFLNMKKMNRQEILSIFRVPPSIAGIFEFENSTSRSAGVRDQRIQFWSDSVQPVLRRILRSLNRQVSPLFNPNFEIQADVSKIPALKETEDMLKTRAETAALLIEKAGWSPNSVLAELYPEKEPFDWGDEPSPAYSKTQQQTDQQTDEEDAVEPEQAQNENENSEDE
jgi:HK97 family phage portal protein